LVAKALLYGLPERESRAQASTGEYVQGKMKENLLKDKQGGINRECGNGRTKKKKKLIAKLSSNVRNGKEYKKGNVTKRKQRVTSRDKSLHRT